MVVGIAKFTMTDKKLERQLIRLNKYGCDKIFKLNRANPKLLQELLQNLSYQSDYIEVIVVEELSLFKSSLKQLEDLVNSKSNNPIRIVCLNDKLNSGSERGLLRFKNKIKALRKRKTYSSLLYDLQKYD